MKPPQTLPLFFDGRQYDLKWRHLTADLSFWLHWAKTYGDPILELGCGTGRVTLHLAKAGFHMTGLDVFESMLKEARRKSIERKLPVEWVREDMRSFELNRKFPLIIVPFNTLTMLTEIEDFEACMGCVARHLSPGGKFIIDVFNPSLEILSRDPKDRFPHREYGASDGGGTIVVTETNNYDSVHQVNHLKLFYRFPDRKEETVEEVLIRIFHPLELDALLKYNGFKVARRFGDYNGKPFESSSPKQLIVCTAKT